MPGCARRVRPAYSRTLCLPCLKAGFFCFYTTATDLFMSSFLFLHFCDDVFELLGLYFSASILSRVSSGGFLPLPSKPPQGSHTASTGLVCGFAGVVPYPASKTAHKAAQGRVWFLPRTNLPLPLKGEGLGIILVGFALLAHNRANHISSGITNRDLTPLKSSLHLYIKKRTPASARALSCPGLFTFSSSAACHVSWVPNVHRACPRRGSKTSALTGASRRHQTL